MFSHCMDILEKMAFNVRRIRVANGISQDELALISNVERAYVGHIERGKKNPTVITLDKLAMALDCSVADFFAETEEELDNPTLPPGRKSGSGERNR